MKIITKVEAKERGLKHYYTGILCKNGHMDKRYTSNGRCMECNRIIAREYHNNHIEESRERSNLWKKNNKEAVKEYRYKNYWKDPEAAREYASVRRKKNPEKARETDRRCKKRNKEKYKERGRQRYKENPEKFREQARARYYKNRDKANNASKKWRVNNPEKYRDSKRRHRINHQEKIQEYQRKWAKNNPEKIREYTHRRRSRKRGAEGTHTAADIKEILRKQKYRCIYCKANLRKGYHADHIMPLSKGGDNTKLNLQMLCPQCNNRKYNKDPIIYAHEQGMLL